MVPYLWPTAHPGPSTRTRARVSVPTVVLGEPPSPLSCAEELGHSWDILGSPSVCPIPFCAWEHLPLPVSLLSVCRSCRAVSLPDPPVQAPARGLQEYF